MKFFEYSFDISYGQGCGFVVAESKEAAEEMIMRNDPPSDKSTLVIEEIDLTKSLISVHSYSE